LLFYFYAPRPKRGSVAELLVCWTQAQKGPGSNRSATLSGNSLRQTVHTHRASVHQAAKLVAALLRVAMVTAGLAESNGSYRAMFMTHVTCRLIVEIRDQLRNPKLANRVWATFTFLPKRYRDPLVCLSHGTLAACSLAASGHQRCADPSADGRRSAAIFATVELPSAGGDISFRRPRGDTLLPTRRRSGETNGGGQRGTVAPGRSWRRGGAKQPHQNVFLTEEHKKWV